MQRIEKIMLIIGILGIGALLNLFWLCWFSPEMSFPIHALRLFWLPSMPLFLMFSIVIFVGFQRNRRALPLLMCFTPIFILGGLMGITGLGTIIKYGFSLFLFQPCLLGFLQVILSVLIIFSWFFPQYK